MRAQLLLGAAAAVLIGLGLWLWSREGTMIWLQDAIRYCF